MVDSDPALIPPEVTARPDAAEIAGLWADVLDVSSPLPDEDFFELGGDSFAAIRLIERLSREHSVELTLPKFFEQPTLRGILAVAGLRLRSTDD